MNDLDELQQLVIKQAQVIDRLRRERDDWRQEYYTTLECLDYMSIEAARLRPYEQMYRDLAAALSELQPVPDD